MTDNEEEAELRDFIIAALKQIVEGVTAASSDVEDLGGEVNPHPGGWQRVHFDVDVEVLASSGDSLRLGIGAIGGAKQAKDRERRANRLRFFVPLRLPG